jgi:hypothetical protein
MYFSETKNQHCDTCIELVREHSPLLEESDLMITSIRCIVNNIHGGILDSRKVILKIRFQ